MSGRLPGGSAAAVRAAFARRFIMLAIASGLAIAQPGCGDDQVPLAFCPAGGNGGAAAGGAAGDQGGAGVAGNGGAGGGGGGATGGAAGSVVGTGGGGRGVAAGGGGAGGRGGAGGTAGSGAAGRGGTGGAGGGTVGRGGAGGRGGGAGTGGGSPTPGYTGCTHVGGVYRMSVTKLATAGTSGKCFDLVLWTSTQTSPAGLTLPHGWSLMTAVARPCTGEGSSSTTTATSVTGSVTWDPTIAFSLPPFVNLNVVLGFASDAGVPVSEPMVAQLVNVQASCP